MNNKDQIRWKKLSINLEILTVSDPNSIIPIILDIHNLIFDEDCSNDTIRKLNFMSYELQSRTKNLTESDRKTILGDYIFNERNFTASSLSSKTIDINEWKVSETIENKQGTTFLISLIYLHLAQDLQIPIYLINSKEDHILKWIKGGEPVYLDITSNATELSEKKLCELIVKNNSKGSFAVDTFDILPAKNIVIKYLVYIYEIFKIKRQPYLMKLSLDVLLKLEPANLEYLKSRAFISKKLNLYREAINDIRKYYSLNGEENSPDELKAAYYELKNMSIPKSNLLH